MLNQPITQVPLTNVAVVRYKHKNKRFELACYPNKVSNWRNNIEKDIDEVLQLNEIYICVQKGVVAKKKELEQSFGNTPKPDIIRLILNEGELQVTELERKAQSNSQIKDVATIISEKCVDATTGRLVPSSLVLRALEQHHISVKENQPAKKQALYIIKTFARQIGLVRAKMRIRINFGSSEAISAIIAFFTVEHRTDDMIVGLICPENFREIHKFIEAKKLQESVSVQVIDQVVTDVRPEAQVEEVKIAPVQKKAVRDKLKCTSCPDCEFDDVNEHRQHFKSMWHRYNLKRKVRELDGISHPEFTLLSTEEVERLIKSSKVQLDQRLLEVGVDDDMLRRGFDDFGRRSVGLVRFPSSIWAYTR